MLPGAGVSVEFRQNSHPLGSRVRKMSYVLLLKPPKRIDLKKSLLSLVGAEFTRRDGKRYLNPG